MFKKPIRYNIILFCCLIILLNSNIAKASKGEINELYIEGKGNNKYESQIKAHTVGMRRAFYLISDKLKIDKERLLRPSYSRLKKTLSVKFLRNEKITKTSYSALVSYEYDKGKFWNLLQEYGDESIDDKFQEAIVIPVFKQNKNLKLWGDNWVDLWNNSRIIMKENKIFLPTESIYLSRKIRPDNLFDLKFNDYIDIFRDSFFKSVIIVSAEFFTNRKTGGSNIRVLRYTILPKGDNPILVTNDYTINNLDDIPTTVDVEVDKIINEYGRTRNDVETSSDDLDNFSIIDEDNLPIVMNFSAYENNEVEIIRKKLESVKEIDKFDIRPDDIDNRYNIIIYTDRSEYELAEGLYNAGLSYKIYGKLYHLIDIKEGG